MSAVFTHEEFQCLLERFTAVIPGLLASSRHTVDLARQMDALLDTAESPFTVAVIGQMRAGKSTLLNALIGRDLAVTGVNETTATINWFKHADTLDDCGRFRVTWKDAPAEFLPLDRLKDWVGDSEAAKRTQNLAFFAPSDFLRTANIVDTPGTRSLIADHTEKLQEFLATKCHADTVKQGGRADAIIYVLMPVARQADDALLQEFEGKTRMPGSHPYNSLAVLHKWEAMIDGSDPFTEANKKAEKVLKALRGHVSCVIPVSAPMAICSDRLSDVPAFWDSLFRLGKSPATAIEEITMDEAYYAKAEIPECSMTSVERESLRQMVKARYPGLPWPSFKVMLLAAHGNDITNPNQLRARVAEMSGVSKLKAELDKRYFACARTIKAFSVLGKAWEPCSKAQNRLRREKTVLDARLHDTKAALGLLESRIASGDFALTSTRDCLRASTAVWESEFLQTSSLLRQIGDEIREIQDAYEAMDAEIKAMEKLENIESAFTLEEQVLLRSLLGTNGPDLSNRLVGIVVDPSAPTVKELEKVLGFLNACARRLSGDARDVMETAIRRAEMIADHVERGT